MWMEGRDNFCLFVLLMETWLSPHAVLGFTASQMQRWGVLFRWQQERGTEITFHWWKSFCQQSFAQAPTYIIVSGFLIKFLSILNHSERDFITLISLVSLDLLGKGFQNWLMKMGSIAPSAANLRPGQLLSSLRFSMTCNSGELPHWVSLLCSQLKYPCMSCRKVLLCHCYTVNFPGFRNGLFLFFWHTCL